jgi:hypothetical protein
LQRCARESAAPQLEGSPAMEKTALWLEALAAARRHSAAVLTARPVEIKTKLAKARNRRLAPRCFAAS